MAPNFVDGRSPQPDEEFISDCGLPNNPEAARIALAVRRSIAGHGMNPGYVRASDRYPGRLEALSGWDSPDLVELLLELERELGYDIPAEEVFQGVDFGAFSVRDLVDAAYQRRKAARDA